MDFIDDVVGDGKLNPDQIKVLEKIKRPQLLADIGESMLGKPDDYSPETAYFPLREMD